MRYFVLYMNYLQARLSFELVEITPEKSALRSGTFLNVGINDFGEHHYVELNNKEYLPPHPLPNGTRIGSSNFVDTRLIFRDVISTSVVIPDINSTNDIRFPKFVDSVRGIMGTADERICLFLNSRHDPLRISAVSWWGGLPATKMQVISDSDEPFSLMVHLRRKERIVTHNVHVCTTSEKHPNKRKCLEYIDIVAGSDKQNAIPSVIEYANTHANNLKKIYPNGPGQLTLYSGDLHSLVEKYLRRLQYELFGV